jgi:hypothetical protein
VREELAAAGLRPRVVHSTSWRQEQRRLIVTYLAILDRPDAAIGRLVVRRVERAPLAIGTATAAPARICQDQVVEHALRHLSWLTGHDRAVRDALPPAWSPTLKAYSG